MTAWSTKLKSKTFSTKEAVQSGLTKYHLKRLLDEGEIIQIARGYYQFLNSNNLGSDEQSFESVIARVGFPSAVCLTSALIHFGLTDSIGKKTWVMVPANIRRRFSDIRLVRMRNAHFDIGIEKTQAYWITSLERTLVDSIACKNIVGTQIALEALKLALIGRKTTLNKIFEMSKQLKISHRVIPYLEVLYE
jgi:predicted transcriptional regulator of viral defense system